MGMWKATETKMEILSLNLGCGNEKIGDVKSDLIKSPTVDVLAHAEYLPFRNASFSFVFSNNLFEHLGNPLQSLKEQYRVLKKGGKLGLVTDNASYWRFHVLSKSSHLIYRGRGKRDKHFMLFMPFHLENFFREIGFVNVKWYWVGEKGYRITGAINWIFRRIRFLRHISYGRIRIEGSV